MMTEETILLADLPILARSVLQQFTNTTRAAVVALQGDLGAGKTTFVQVVARELGILETVTSPTFVVMKQYEITTPTTQFETLIHIDAYRIETVEEMEVLGFREWLAETNTLLCIEWAERIKEILPPHYVELTLSAGEAADERKITIERM